MLDFLVVFCTCGSEEEARKLAQAAIEKHLAACVNVLGGVQSIYRWQGAIETASEHLLVIKTTQERFADLEKMLAELHSYENPEIIGVPLTFGSDKYLAWIQQSV